ncbi:MAG: hypothetical protein IKX25_02450 [Bacteroidales bacterium]|nr:hypothetical protein [Bacteroidales bacterium]
MKKVFLSALLLMTNVALLKAQDISTITMPIDKDLYPTKGEFHDFSPRAIQEFNDRAANYEKMVAKYEAGEITQEQLEAVEYDDTLADIYDILGGGCSFYCGCQYDTVFASSSLRSQGQFSYDANNAADLSYESAWVEGKAGNGIGEWIEYQVPANNPRITTIIVCNGYYRTRQAWEQNGRVKKLEVTINGQKFTTLHLDDVYADQYFDVGEIGWNRKEGTEPGTEPIRIRFTILEVYPGTKYDDTAITEIYFDGIDVH